MFVACDDDRLAAPLGHRDRHDLIGEPPRLDGGDRPAVALERERILAAAIDRPSFGDVLACLAHRVRAVLRGQRRVDEPPAERRVLELPRSAIPGCVRLRHDIRRPGHRFDTAADEDITVADGDRVGRRVDRLQTAPAQAIHGEAADLDRQAGEEECHPRDVAVVLARLVRAAEDDVLDAARIDAGAVDDGPDDRCGQVVRPDGGEGAAIPTDRGPDGLDDPRVPEGPLLVADHRPSIIYGIADRASAAWASVAPPTPNRVSPLT